MNNELTVTSPDGTASECYALIYNHSSDALFLRNVEAVITIGLLTSEQCCCLDSEFRKRYTETETNKKCVRFVLEHSEYAHCLSNISEDVPRYTIDDIHKQNEVMFDVMSKILETLASIDKKIGQEFVNVNITNADEFRNVIYEGTTMAIRTAEVDRWHTLSVTKFGGKGWSDIVDLEFPKLRNQSKARANKAKEIERAVRTHRDSIGYTG